MAGLYSAETLEEISEFRTKWIARNSTLQETVISRGYRTIAAAEYARHGLGRRLRSLEHDSDRVFALISPDIDVSPPADNVLDATAFIQSFIANVYGAIDNFARIWCLEADVRNEKGNKVADGNIGFRPKNVTVRSSLSPQFQARLTSFDPWFEYLENYRHAIAHRIPIYIPPKTLSEEDGKTYMKLETDGAAALKAGKKNEFWQIFAKQRDLGVFRPYIMHSFGEGAKPIAFHVQMNADLATVVEIGEATLQELDSIAE